MTKSMDHKTVGRTNAKGTDAVELLKSEHRDVEGLFEEFERAKDGASSKKAAVVQKICSALVSHAAIEEEIFYPALRQAEVDLDIMDEADIEHAGAMALVEQLEDMKPDDDHYDAKVKVLSEYIRHHVKEEESDMFKAARASDVDLVALGLQMGQRKAELKGRT